MYLDIRLLGCVSVPYRLVNNMNIHHYLQHGAEGTLFKVGVLIVSLQ